MPEVFFSNWYLKIQFCSTEGTPPFHYEDQSVYVALFQKVKWNISTHPVVKKKLLFRISKCIIPVVLQAIREGVGYV